MVFATCRFWATVMREEGVHIMLESYLNNTPRFYAINPASFSDQVKHAIASVHGLVIKVFLRMSTVIESKVGCAFSLTLLSPSLMSSLFAVVRWII